jgi:hypothetical protein
MLTKPKIFRILSYVLVAIGSALYLTQLYFIDFQNVNFDWLLYAALVLGFVALIFFAVSTEKKPIAQTKRT